MSYLKDEIPFCHSTFRSKLRSCTHCDIFVLDAAFTAMPRTEKHIKKDELQGKQLANKHLISRIKIVKLFNALLFVTWSRITLTSASVI